MSEQAPETPAGRGRTPTRRENVFTRRIGPLPMWQWLLIALGMLSVYVIFEYRKKNKPANAAAGTGTGGAGAADIPQFVNQTNTYVSPPSAPVMPPGSVNSPGSPPVPPAQGGHAPSLTAAPSPSVVPWSSLGISGNPGGGAQTLGQLLSRLQGAGYSLNNLTINGQTYNVPSTGAGAGANHVGSQYLNRPVISATPYGNKLVNVAI